MWNKKNPATVTIIVHFTSGKSLRLFEGTSENAEKLMDGANKGVFDGAFRVGFVCVNLKNVEYLQIEE